MEMTDELRMITGILKWAEDFSGDFDVTFVLNLRGQYERKGVISERQFQALENIIEKFQIDIDKWVDDG